MTDTPSFSLDPSSTAIIFIEYQNEFTSEGGKLHPAVKDCMEKTNSEYDKPPQSCQGKNDDLSMQSNPTFHLPM